METDALTRELIDLRMRPSLARVRDVLAEPFRARGGRRTRLLATLELFMELHTWRTLRRTLPAEDVVGAAVRAVSAQADR